MQRFKALGVEHRLTKPRTPQTNGMVERFNGRISEVIKQTRFASAAELASTLNNYWQAYNHHIPQRALGHVSPIDSLKNWHQKKPELFRKRIYKQAELDKHGLGLGLGVRFHGGFGPAGSVIGTGYAWGIAGKSMVICWQFVSV